MQTTRTFKHVGEYVVEASEEYNNGGPVIAIKGSHPIAVMFADWDLIDLDTKADCLAEADYIVRACNSHADLLEALEHAYRWHDQLSPTDVATLRAAIAKAKGE